MNFDHLGKILRSLAADALALVVRASECIRIQEELRPLVAEVQSLKIVQIRDETAIADANQQIVTVWRPVNKFEKDLRLFVKQLEAVGEFLPTTADFDRYRTRIRDLVYKLAQDRQGQEMVLTAISFLLNELCARFNATDLSSPHPFNPALEAITDAPIQKIQIESRPAELETATNHHTSEPAAASTSTKNPDLNERKAVVDHYKSECRAARVKVTDSQIAKAANNRWNTRDPISKWKAGKDRPGDDQRIRRVFRDKPHIKSKQP